MSEKVQISLDVLRKLVPDAERMGIELPGIARFAPTVDLSLNIRTLALEMGKLLSKEDIFLQHEQVVTVDKETGTTKPMTPARFCGWVEEFLTITCSQGNKRMRSSMTREDADLILNQDIFRECLRPLLAVHSMRLPVSREDSPWNIEFLSPGYDAESRIYTVPLIEYKMDWTLERANEFLTQDGENYPWAWPDDNRPPLNQNRSWSVHVAAMVGTYCKAMFAPGTQKPIISYLANQPGTGKSTLAAMALMPVYGHASTTKTPKDDAEMDKTLETVAHTLQPYLFFDDVGHGLFSSPLNRFVTSSSHTARVMGGNSHQFRVPNVTQVFATGNDLKVSRDLMRRSLVVELFLAGDVAGRKFSKIISLAYLAKLETRKQYLAAFCAIVKNAIEMRKKLTEAGLPIPEPQGLDSFEHFTSIVSTIVQLAGYSDPLAKADISAGGAEDEDEMRELLVRIASDAEGDNEFDRKELVEEARDRGLLESIVGTKGEKDLDNKGMSRWGRQLERWRGRELIDSKGRKFRFSHRKMNKGARYPLQFIRPPGPATAPEPEPEHAEPPEWPEPPEVDQ